MQIPSEAIKTINSITILGLVLKMYYKHILYFIRRYTLISYKCRYKLLSANYKLEIINIHMYMLTVRNCFVVEKRNLSQKMIMKNIFLCRCS